MLNDFELKRLKYIISQLEKKASFTTLGLGDAAILKKLVQKDIEDMEWKETLTKVKEGLNGNKT